MGVGRRQALGLDELHDRSPVHIVGWLFDDLGERVLEQILRRLVVSPARGQNPETARGGSSGSRVVRCQPAHSTAEAM